MHHLRFTPVRPPLRHRCTTTPPSRPITIPPQPSSWLESSIPPTLAGRECSGQLQVFTFRASSVSPSLPRPPPPLSYLFFRLRLLLLLALLLFFAVVVLYSRIKRPGRLSSLIASQVTLREALNFGVSFFRHSAIAPRQRFFPMSQRLQR